MQIQLLIAYFEFQCIAHPWWLLWEQCHPDKAWDNFYALDLLCIFSGMKWWLIVIAVEQKLKVMLLFWKCVEFNLDGSLLWDDYVTHLLFHEAFVITVFTFVVTCFSAWRSGGRFLYLWFATILHGLVVESLSYFVPDIDNFWHAQSMVMFLGKRLPLHVVVLCRL